MPRLKVISRLGVGLDNIDLEYANKNNINIYKSKTTPALSVVELTLGLILNIIRKINYQNNQLKSGVWEKHMGELVSGKTFGIIGLGKIGKELVKLIRGFNLDIIAHDVYEDTKFAKKYDIQYLDLNSLIQKADILSIHLNLNSDTEKLIDYSKFKLMKRNAILINTSRGEIINEDDLIKALENNLIDGAGIDVFQNEPYKGELLRYDNVIVTPHIGSYAKEIRIKMELEAAKNIIRGFDNG